MKIHRILAAITLLTAVTACASEPREALRPANTQAQTTKVDRPSAPPPRPADADVVPSSMNVRPLVVGTGGTVTLTVRCEGYYPPLDWRVAFIAHAPSGEAVDTLYFKDNTVEIGPLDSGQYVVYTYCILVDCEELFDPCWPPWERLGGEGEFADWPTFTVLSGPIPPAT